MVMGWECGIYLKKTFNSETKHAIGGIIWGLGIEDLSCYKYRVICWHWGEDLRVLREIFLGGEKKSWILLRGFLERVDRFFLHLRVDILLYWGRVCDSKRERQFELSLEQFCLLFFEWYSKVRNYCISYLFSFLLWLRLYFCTAEFLIYYWVILLIVTGFAVLLNLLLPRYYCCWLLLLLFLYCCFQVHICTLLAWSEKMKY